MLSDRLKHRSISREAYIGLWGHGPRYGSQTLGRFGGLVAPLCRFD